MLPVIRKIKHPRYSHMIMIIDPTQRERSGRAKRRPLYFKSQAEAERKLAEIQGTILAGGVRALDLSPEIRADVLNARALLDVDYPHVTFTQLARDFLDSKGRGPANRSELEPFLERFLDHKVHEEGATMVTRHNLDARVKAWMAWQQIATIADITPERCLALRTRRGADGKLLAAQTRKNDMNAVSSFLTYLVREEKVLTFNPLHEQRRPKIERGRPRVYAAKDCQRILDAVADYEGGRKRGDKRRPGLHARAVGLLFLAGLRPSEVKQARIHLDGQTPLVRVEGGKMRGRANRVVPLSPEAAAWLREQPTPIVLPTTGERRKICDLAGVRWIQDAARHTWISAKCELLADDAVVARMAGTSKDIIFAHYHALMSPEEARAVERLGRPTSKAESKKIEPVRAEALSVGA